MKCHCGSTSLPKASVAKIAVGLHSRDVVIYSCSSCDLVINIETDMALLLKKAKAAKNQ